MQSETRQQNSLRFNIQYYSSRSR